uniref:Uncharacterized protein n=1 Tax=Knipowitschia caucasica TaxID=637954 RepID=A0AAV2ITF5_KNICA
METTQARVNVQAKWRKEGEHAPECACSTQELIQSSSILRRDQLQEVLCPRERLPTLATRRTKTHVHGERREPPRSTSSRVPNMRNLHSVHLVHEGDTAKKRRGSGLRGSLGSGALGSGALGSGALGSVALGSVALGSGSFVRSRWTEPVLVRLQSQSRTWTWSNAAFAVTTLQVILEQLFHIIHEPPLHVLQTL